MTDSFVDNNDWLQVLSLIMDDQPTILLWLIRQIKQKRQELGPEVINEAAAALIIAREMGFSVHNWEVRS